jgi:hypothetical protein
MHKAVVVENIQDLLGIAGRVCGIEGKGSALNYALTR